MQNNARTEHLAAAVKTFHKKDFSSLTELAQGGEGITYKGRHAYFGDVCAKVFFRGPAQGTNHNEVRLLLKHGHHPNVVQLFGLFEDDDHPVLRAQIGYVMEFMHGGSLSSVIYSNYRYNERHVYNWVSQAAKGLQHLHQAGIIHRDVKPANMLLDESKKKLKISDFGIARANDLHTKTQVGTHIYMAPEMFCGHHQYGLPVDVYALGISFWEMLYRSHPFNGDNYPDKRLRPGVDSKFSPMAQTLLQQCWNNAPYDRPSVMQIITTLDDHMERMKPQERIFTAVPEDGPYQDVATVSTQRSSGSSGYSSVPQTPATAPVQGHPLAPGTTRPVTVPEEKPRKKHKHKREKRREETYSNEDWDPNLSGANLMMDLLTQSMQNTNISGQKNKTLQGNKSVDATTDDMWMSTLCGQLLRLSCPEFQNTKASLINFFQNCLTDDDGTMHIRLFGIGPNGHLPNDVAIFKQLGYTVDIQKYCDTYTECYRRLFFIHFCPHVDDNAGMQKFTQLIELVDEIQRIYMEGSVPRFLLTTRFNVLVVGNSDQLSGQLFDQELNAYCQQTDDELDPLLLYNIKLFSTDFNTGCMAIQACGLATMVQRVGAVHQILYLVDCDVSYGRFGADWNQLASPQHSRIMIGCNTMEEYQNEAQKLRNAFMCPSSPPHITPFLKRPPGNNSTTCFPRICEMYRMFNSVYRQCVMNLVRKTPVVGS